ncbi:MAG: small GTP-binding protein [Planctomycetota bacterium]|jgi:small GTP-binding protein
MNLLSPPGLAGIAILGVAAAERESVLAALETPAGKPCRLVAGQPPMRAVLRLDGQVVDDVLLVSRAGDHLELHVHGAPIVLDQLDQHFGVVVVAASSPAERLLREALSAAQFWLALEQLSFDFDDELAALRALPDCRAGVAAARERSRVAQALVDPLRVVLVGQQNAGKSSLFNQLLFRERALTGDTPGLTRDAIAEVTTLAGYPYELVDTAGEGPAASELDQAAIESGRSWRRGALVVLVIDGSVAPTVSDRSLLAESSLVVRSKADLPQAPWPLDVACDLEVSMQTGTAEQVRTTLGSLLASQRRLPISGLPEPRLPESRLLGVRQTEIRAPDPQAEPSISDAVGESMGGVGGFAALDEVQRSQLFALDADCQADAPSA